MHRRMLTQCMAKVISARSLWAGAVVGLIALAGPSEIHLALRAATPLAEKKANEDRYHQLATAEAFDPALSDTQRISKREERLNLFYWFHARGWSIDEGDEPKSWLHPWRELFRYWSSPKEAVQTLPPKPGVTRSP